MGAQICRPLSWPSSAAPHPSPCRSPAQATCSQCASNLMPMSAAEASMPAGLKCREVGRVHTHISENIVVHQQQWHLTNWPLYAGCGGPVTAPSGEIHSPLYPNSYPNNVDCSWVISVDPHHRVLFNFTDLDIEFHGSCSLDYVDVSNWPMFQSSVCEHVCKIGKWEAQCEDICPLGRKILSVYHWPFIFDYKWVVLGIVQLFWCWICLHPLIQSITRLCWIFFLVDWCFYVAASTYTSPSFSTLRCTPGFCLGASPVFALSATPPACLRIIALQMIFSCTPLLSLLRFPISICH